MIAKEILNQSRVFLNDQDGAIFNDIALIPLLQTAWDELAELYEENEMPTQNKVASLFTITTGMIDIGGLTGPALPIDLVEIQSLHERTAGTNNDFSLMAKVEFLPNYTVLSAFLQFWSWQGQVIKFLGALTNIEIKMEYTANIFNKIIDANSLINILNCKTALAYRTAGLAASTIGENPTRATELNGFASNATERLINVMMRAQQSIVTRRRPFRGNYKMRTIN